MIFRQVLLVRSVMGRKHKDQQSADQGPQQSSHATARLSVATMVTQRACDPCLVRLIEMNAVEFELAPHPTQLRIVIASARFFKKPVARSSAERSWPRLAWPQPNL
jgi:hypothetical protein